MVIVSHQKGWLWCKNKTSLETFSKIFGFSLLTVCKLLVYLAQIILYLYFESALQKRFEKLTEISD